ncbi:MAG TPA: glycosyltransferase family 9 protein [Candidatus Acidoferrum sp.]|nr:glycosyltransferase family 9 protein [Candidatus Acidoferrum sp.]
MSVKSIMYLLAKPLLRTGAAGPAPLDIRKLSSILIIRPEKLGDLLVSLPLCEALKRANPDLKLYLLASSRGLEAVQGDPRFEQIFLYRKQAISDFRTARAIRRLKVDFVIDLVCDDSVTSLFLTQYCARGRACAGMGKNQFRKHYDFNFPYRTDNDAHVIDNTLKILGAFGIDSRTADPYVPLHIGAEATRKATEWLTRSVPHKSGALRIGINQSAGSPNRIWPDAKTKELISRIKSRHDESQIILIYVARDRQRAEALALDFDSGVCTVPLGLNLEEVSAIISRLDALVSPDTSLIHIARSFHVPVVGLYSRFMDNYRLWRPYGQSEGAVVSSSDVDICDIPFDQVFDTLQRLLNAEKEVAR